MFVFLPKLLLNAYLLFKSVPALLYNKHKNFLLLIFKLCFLSPTVTVDDSKLSYGTNNPILFTQNARAQSRPDPYLTVSVGKKTENTAVQMRTDSPVYEIGYSFLVQNPEIDMLDIKVSGTIHTTSIRAPEGTPQILMTLRARSVHET